MHLSPHSQEPRTVGLPLAPLAGLAAQAATGPARRHAQVQLCRAWWYRTGGRAAQLAMVAMVVVLLGVRVASGALLPHGPGISGAVGPESVVVEADDTWWSVATELFPERDPRQAVDLVRERAGSLRPGERIDRASLLAAGDSGQVAAASESQHRDVEAPIVSGGSK